MAYVSNLPRRGRPRGLGDVAAKASTTFGTWVVDNFWGLSPKNISGQPRPYGQTVVQTFLPRTNQPRLMNLHMGPVVPGGTQPLLRRMNNNPVFRTPVDRPGAVQTSLPPGAGPGAPTEVASHRASGYGWIPMGIATPPSALLEPPGMQGLGAACPTHKETAMDPAYLKRSAEGYGMQSPQSYYSRLRDGRHIPYGDQMHSTFYDRQHPDGRWTPYGGMGAMGHSQVHSTFYDRQHPDGRWTPYGGAGGFGDFVYKPVTNAQEVMPGAEMEAYGDYVQLPYGAFGQGGGMPWGLLAAAGLGFMLWQGMRKG